jgi:indolepyruvate ferredoxin oxidoreductase beta subunit
VKKTFSVLIAGIGGQGVLAVSRMIAMAATCHFPFVSRTESRGLSQRGGAVFSEVRFGEMPVSPAIAWKSANVVLSMDALEGARALPFLAEDGQLIANRCLSVPTHLREQWRLQQSEAESGTELSKAVDSLWPDFGRLMLIDAQEVASSLGLKQSVNSVMLGAASQFLPIPAGELRAVLVNSWSAERSVENCKAYDAGRQTALRIFSAAHYDSHVIAV